MHCCMPVLGTANKNLCRQDHQRRPLANGPLPRLRRPSDHYPENIVPYEGRVMALDLNADQKALGKANFQDVTGELTRRGFMKSMLATGAAVTVAGTASY